MLTDDQKLALVRSANAARRHAYVPYSGYAVGAALLTTSGRVFTGVNIENAAYPTTICGERTAVFKAVSEGEQAFTAIAVVTSNGGMPCGSCRQVLAEFGVDTIVIIADESERILHELTVRSLLPFIFGPEDLPHKT